MPHGNHVTATQLFELAQSKGLSISLSTIYRQLAALETQGLVQSIGLVRRRARVYEIAPQEKHYHLICIACGRTTEFSDHILNQFGESMARKVGYEFYNSRFDLFGYCQDCQQPEPPLSEDDIIDNLQQLTQSLEQSLNSIRHKRTGQTPVFSNVGEKRLEKIINKVTQLVAALKP